MITIFEYFKSYKKGLNITYSGIVLYPESSDLLLSTFVYPCTEYSDWKKLAHHMTICMGELPEHMKKYWLDEDIVLTATELGKSDKAIAVKVEGFFNISKPTDEDTEIVKFPHITLAINPVDAKPVDSNHITDWEPIDPIQLKGIIQEIRL